MPLRDVQIALGSLLTAQATGRKAAPPTGLNLTAEEDAWLNHLIGTPGFEVTCYIQRWWRETKLRWTARLTLAAIRSARPEMEATMLRRYLDATPLSSLFFTPEAVGFLDFAAHEAAALPHVADVARFERALLIVKDAAMQFADQNARADSQNSDAVRLEELKPYEGLAPHPAAALLELAAPPEELLGALVTGRSLPPARAERFPILIAPGLPHLWRPATPTEAQLFQACQLSATVADLLALVPGAEQLLDHLLQMGALRRES